MPTSAKTSLEDQENRLAMATWQSFEAKAAAISSSIDMPTPAVSVVSAAESFSTFPAITLQQRNQAAILSELPTSKLSDYKIRMLHFARAAILALKYQEPKLSETEIGTKAALIKKHTDSFLDHLDELAGTANGMKKLRSECNAFFMHLAQSIQVPTQSYKAAEKQLLEAERILTWQDGRAQHTNISYIEQNGRRLKIERSEVAVCRLTTPQKQEFLARKSKAWYKTLSPMLKKYIDDHVPTTLEGDWSVIERPIPAILRGVPGLANFTHNTTLITDVTNPADPKELSRSSVYRSATAIPIDLKGILLANERQRLAQQNIEQYVQVILEKHLDDYLRTKNLLTTGSVEEKLQLANTEAAKTGERLHFTLPLNSLLNELFGEAWLPHGENNTRFMVELRRAAKAIQQNYAQRYPHITMDLFVTSTPVNDCRYFLITTNAEGKADDQRYIRYCTQRLLILKNSIRAEEARSIRNEVALQQLLAEYKLISAAKTALEGLQNRQDCFGDLGLIRAALYEIIIPDSISACKSGKDRLMYKQDYAAALRTYYAAHGHFPDFRLPKKLARSTSLLGYLGITLAATASALILLAGVLFPPLAITVLIAAAAAGGALSLGIGAYAFFKASPDFAVRYDFLKILRHIRYSGFGALSAAGNAPGVYGQKNSDIAPDDLSRTNQRQAPFRSKKQLIDLGLYLLGAGGTATAAYFLLTTFLLLPTPAVVALPIILALVVAIPLITYVGTKFIQYRSAPKLKDAAEIAARASFKLGLREEHEIAKGNKYKGKATAREIAEMKESSDIIPASKEETESCSSVSASASFDTGGTEARLTKKSPHSTLVVPVPLETRPRSYQESKFEEAKRTAELKKEPS